MNPTDQRTQSEQTAALDAIRQLLEAHYREAEDAADDEGRFSIAFKATFDRSFSPAKLKVTSRISKSFTDEIEFTLPDPAQPELL